MMNQQGCADCPNYVDVIRLIRMPDGREICPSCACAAREIAARKSQLEMFDAQTTIFDLFENRPEPCP